MSTDPTVLIVDDSKNSLRAVEAALSDIGARLIPAQSGEQALREVMACEEIAVIVLDIGMPGMNGFEVAELLRQRQRLASTPILFMTGIAMNQQEVFKGYELGAVDYIFKPVDLHVLKSKVSVFVELRRQSENLRRFNEILEEQVKSRTADLEASNRVLEIEVRERKRAEQDAHERKERLQAVLDTAADAIITIDQSGIITSINLATERMFGYENEEELVGKNFSILMPPSYPDEHEGFLARYQKTGEAWIMGQRRELSGRRNDGSRLPLEIVVTEIEHLGLFCGIIRDLSEKKVLEREVADISTLEQQRIGQEIHDGLGQQLTALGLMTTKLKRDLDKLDIPLANTVEDMSSLLQQAMTEMLALSHGLSPVPVTPEGLDSALRKLAKVTQASTGTPCRFESNSPVKVVDQTTAMQLYRIAQEAVNNAIKYSEAELIIIKLEQGEDYTSLAISDDGKGFNLNEKIKAGYGLRIMNYRAGIVGSHIRIQTQQGKGTQIICRFTPKVSHSQILS
jgi:PAS domain S-box-containing protein